MDEINDLRRQFRDGQWKQFIRSITLTNLRGWSGQTVNFNFPVVAIVGENGIGKSTFLRAAACIYQSKTTDKFNFYPSSLFINTQWDSRAIENALIECFVQAGDETRMLSWKKTNDWGFSPRNKKVKRDVFFLDTSRTLPLDATAGYAKLAKLAQAEGSSHLSIDEEHLKKMSYVLGREYASARFTNTEITDKEIGLLGQNFGEVSQFHQGAGEDTVLDTFKILQSISSQSLLIIDEVEASLHPLAQRRLVHILLNIARVKKIQIILSTHSPFVLEELPSEARVLLMGNSNGKKVLYDVSSKFALSTIDENAHPDLYIYVEDEEAEILLWEILKQADNYTELIQKISIKPAGSSSTVNTLFTLTSQDKLPENGLAFIDGDQKCEYPDCPSLPGDLAPEKMIMQDLKNNEWIELDNRFGVGAGTLFKILDDACLLPNHHDWTAYIGDKIRKSRDYVWRILVEEWCKHCLSVDDRIRIIDTVNNKMNH